MARTASEARRVFRAPQVKPDRTASRGVSGRRGGQKTASTANRDRQGRLAPLVLPEQLGLPAPLAHKARQGHRAKTEPMANRGPLVRRGRQGLLGRVVWRWR